MHVKSICSCTHIFLRNQKIKKNASWAASVAQRISDGMREYTKSQEPGLAPQPGQLFLKRILRVWARVARWYIFKPKIPIWQFLMGLEMEKIGILNGHLEHITDIWYIVWPFWQFCGNLVYFSPFWSIESRKIWQPCSETSSEADFRQPREENLVTAPILTRSYWFFPRAAAAVNLVMCQLEQIVFRELDFRKDCWQNLELADGKGPRGYVW
jgi:hypothetical protein